MTRVICRLTAKNRDQLRNPTLGNRVWATFTFTSRYKGGACNIVQENSSVFSPDQNALVAISNGMQAEKLYSNEIPCHHGAVYLSEDCST